VLKREDSRLTSWSSILPTSATRTALGVWSRQVPRAEVYAVETVEVTVAKEKSSPATEAGGERKRDWRELKGPREMPAMAVMASRAGVVVSKDSAGSEIENTLTAYMPTLKQPSHEHYAHWHTLRVGRNDHEICLANLCKTV